MGVGPGAGKSRAAEEAILWADIRRMVKDYGLGPQDFEALQAHAQSQCPHPLNPQTSERMRRLLNGEEDLEADLEAMITRSFKR